MQKSQSLRVRSREYVKWTPPAAGRRINKLSHILRKQAVYKTYHEGRALVFRVQQTYVLVAAA